jgi:hypothetical protein
VTPEDKRKRAAERKKLAKEFDNLRKLARAGDKHAEMQLRMLEQFAKNAREDLGK